MAPRSIMRDTKIATCGHKYEQRPPFRFEAFESQLPTELMCQDIDFSYPGNIPRHCICGCKLRFWKDPRLCIDTKAWDDYPLRNSAAGEAYMHPGPPCLAGVTGVDGSARGHPRLGRAIRGIGIGQRTALHW
ncbi:hypothetical protein FOIG_09808 [Fusarium odoratissimum NRRL 54006]|uniref:Uncharacterized protein n=2 Tax=Fusarium oxysporum species complex TaxID=171631 RepID=X0JAK9_FUSO5|nr:uncharacterized protein FOIG_09808 [Fusarium odoratissimum NRRL 54006]EXL98258.1 hypothetical protein FOIG_09808 [Fusarium odoratissimum NRRL 54006]TXB96331.1 hypothetical protein FocTR4_00016517 [Fusarium oxysporum f. sp. cubense]